VKQKAITAARQKIGTLLTVEDIVIRNIDLSHELEARHRSQDGRRTGGSRPAPASLSFRRRSKPKPP